MECHGITRIPGSKALTQRDNRLGLVLLFKAMKEHAITHRDACILSSLMMRGIFLQARVFL